ncbi:hypothetical protein ANN_18807 [Periplaneta americana]|uniref:FLYWCH-type domain-containing protein n=1 Tax=Periplaneta americana TaxID=6978 RepID=A0ABQ8SRB2_PERAM|nr:hypothetical protein ANN_18807 [Periplaneta americana]
MERPRLAISQKGKTKLIWKGYLYTKHREGREITGWRCERRGECSARAHLEVGWLFNNAVSITTLLGIDGIGDKEVFGELGPRILHRSPEMCIIGSNLGKTPTREVNTSPGISVMRCIGVDSNFLNYNSHANTQQVRRFMPATSPTVRRGGRSACQALRHWRAVHISDAASTWRYIDLQTVWKPKRFIHSSAARCPGIELASSCVPGARLC